MVGMNMNWSERYTKEANLGHALNVAYQIIWPEGPKTIISDIGKSAELATNPYKRQMAIDTAKLLPGYLQNRAQEIGKGITSLCRRCISGAPCEEHDERGGDAERSSAAQQTQRAFRNPESA